MTIFRYRVGRNRNYWTLVYINDGPVQYIFQCRCGTLRYLDPYDVLIRGYPKSCGCEHVYLRSIKAWKRTPKLVWNRWNKGKSK